MLEILDPQRFCRGVAVDGAKQLEPIMVRRLKDDLRRLQGGFPKREIVEVSIAGLEEDNAELLLPRLLDEYREARQEWLKAAPKSVQSDTRNRTEYEGAIDVDGRLLSDLIKACRTVADKVKQLPPIPKESK